MDDPSIAAEDRKKIATLIHHWIEHNDGHRRSYEEWRTKLSHEDLPRTLVALDRLAALMTEAGEVLRDAAHELDAGAGDVAATAGHGHTHNGPHGHSHEPHEH